MKTAIALIALISLTSSLVWAVPNQQDVQEILGNARDATEQDEDDVDLQSLLAAAQDDDENDEDEDMSALDSLMAAAQDDDGDDSDVNMKALMSLAQGDKNDKATSQRRIISRPWSCYRHNTHNSGYYASYYKRYYNNYYKNYYSKLYKGAKAYGDFGYKVLNFIKSYTNRNFPYMYKKYRYYRGIKIKG